MDATTEDHLKHELYDIDPMFRALVKEHRSYESRLEELAAITHPTEAELSEEAEIKVKKLAVKEKIYAIIQAHG
jgi:uncharacterized protein YdcH (DUF465 family)